MDTPGVLSGEKQRTQRSYDFTGVTSWFAAKCDLILLLFDPHKLDISDEFKRVIGSLRGHDDKIRIVLNKADQVDAQQVNECACSLSCLPLALKSVFEHIPLLYFIPETRGGHIFEDFISQVAADRITKLIETIIAIMDILMPLEDFISKI